MGYTTPSQIFETALDFQEDNLAEKLYTVFSRHPSELLTKPICKYLLNGETDGKTHIPNKAKPQNRLISSQ